MESAARDFKRVTLELGGNDVAIVLPDVDVPAVIEPIFRSAFRYSGHGRLHRYPRRSDR